MNEYQRTVSREQFYARPAENSRSMLPISESGILDEGSSHLLLYSFLGDYAIQEYRRTLEEVPPHIGHDLLNAMKLSTKLESKLVDNVSTRPHYSYANLLNLSEYELVDFAEERLEYIRNNSERIRSHLIPKFLSEFDERFRRMISQGDFPIDLEEYKARFSNIKIDFEDSLLSGLYGVGGGYFPLDARILLFIDGYSGTNHIKNNLFHELLHSISGGTYSAFLAEGEYDDKSNRRLGLGSGSHHRWANEALTEVMCQAMINRRDIRNIKNFTNIDDNSYVGERMLLRLFLEKGGKSDQINKDRLQLAIAAYFHDYQPYNNAGQRASPIAEFYRSMKVDNSLKLWHFINKELSGQNNLSIENAKLIATKAFPRKNIDKISERFGLDRRPFQYFILDLLKKS